MSTIVHVIGVIIILSERDNDNTNNSISILTIFFVEHLYLWYTVYARKL